MARERRLTIGNADKIFNLNFEHVSERNSYIDVLPSNSKKIKVELKQLQEESEGLPLRDDNKYIIYHSATLDDELVELIFRYGGEAIYYTDTIVPSRVMELIAENRYTASAMYSYSDGFSIDRALNVATTFSAGKTLLDIPAQDLTTFDILVELDKIKYSADGVYFYLEDLSKAGDYIAEYEWFVGLRDALSNWRMNIYMLYNTEEEREGLFELKERDSAIRKSSTVW